MAAPAHAGLVARGGRRCSASTPQLCRRDDFAQVFGGNRVPAGADPFAACYGGHQFGSWAGQLGDGRAIALGEVRRPRRRPPDAAAQGRRAHAVLPHAPTAGPCCARRCASSCAARPCTTSASPPPGRCRWWPPATTSCATCSTTATPRPEPGAVVCRVAPSFTRFGTFELPAVAGRRSTCCASWSTSRSAPTSPTWSPAATPTLRRRGWRPGSPRSCERTAALVVDWMRVGLRPRRAQHRQHVDPRPHHRLRALRLARELRPRLDAQHHRRRHPPLPLRRPARRSRTGTCSSWPTPWPAAHRATTSRCEAALDALRRAYQRAASTAMMAEPPGLGRAARRRRRAGRRAVRRARRAPRSTRCCSSATWPGCRSTPAATADDDAARRRWPTPGTGPTRSRGDVRDAFVGWLRAWGRRVVDGGVADDDERRRRMDAVNPRFVLRNYLAQEAIDAAEAGRPVAGRTSCSTCCAAPTTSSRAGSASPPAAPSGPATGSAARCSPAPPDGRAAWEAGA